ncbi:MAG TPA: TonB family protein, partial [Vicinamibacterales bacterium]|nr:TonB family protein [Vicinamibacterales bacterium]
GPTGTIAAYVPGPVGTAGKAPAPAPKKTPRVMRAEPVSKPEPSTGTGQSAGSAPGAGGTGPVRLGSGGNLTLVKKVIPTYPRLLQNARIPGTVVLDATIEPDGSIGDVRVLSSTNDQFAQAAVAAVKQWQYAPIGFEGIVTVTVNFTVPG